jgi:acetyl esterase
MIDGARGGAVRVDPQAQVLLDRIAAQMAQAPKPDHPPSEAERVAMVRQGYAGTADLGGEPERVARVEDRQIPGPGGTVPIRVYQPRPGGSGGPQPVLLWFHGGSFIAGGLDTHDRPLRALANRLGFPVLSVAWRLAPEHPYPAGVEDAYAALLWAAEGDAPDLAIDPARIAVGGDSAGGAVAAVLAQLARDRGGPAVAFQALLYPNTDLAGDGSTYPSWAENDGRILTRADMERNFALYANGADRAQPGLSPLRAPSLSGLPPAFVVTGEADPQRDEGEAYAARLRGVGVTVEHARYPGMIHGFFQMAGVLDAGRDVLDRTAAALRRALSA